MVHQSENSLKTNMVLAHLECKWKDEGKQFVVLPGIVILKLHPRDAENILKNIAEFNIMSLVWKDRDKVENGQSGP